LVLLAFAASHLPTQGQVTAKRASSATSAASGSLPSIRRVQVLGSQTAVEIEIEASEHIAPQAQVLTGPDRLVLDFPNAVPGNQVRSQSVNRGGVKDVRVGLFTSNPLVTRVVLDLNAAQSYQIFPAGRTVIVKLSGGLVDNSAGVDDFPETSPPVTRPGLVNTNFPVRPLPLSLSTTQASARPKLEVSFNNGLLAIRSNKASLSEVLYAVHQRTGADIAVPAGAEQEQVAADIGPAPAAEVLAHLLNGSRFNFLILNSASDARGLDRVILSPRGEAAISGSLVPAAADDTDADEPTQPPVAESATPAPPAPDARQIAPRNPPESDPQQGDSPD
jgi:hypothetical protein